MAGTEWYDHDFTPLTPGADWREPLNWNRKAADSGTRRRVFCPRWNETCGADLAALIAQTPNLDWLLITHRPREMLPALCGGGWPNLGFGTTIKNQEDADRRMPHLRHMPACMRFALCEPLLGPIRLHLPDDDQCYCDHDSRAFFGAPTATLAAATHDLVCPHRQRVDWVIAGGESGPHARPCHPDWIRSLRDQCAVSGVPFFFDQWGEWAPSELHALTPEALPWAPQNYQGMARVGKERAGALLDGRKHREFPRG